MQFQKTNIYILIYILNINGLNDLAYLLHFYNIMLHTCIIAVVRYQNKPPFKTIL